MASSTRTFNPKRSIEPNPTQYDLEEIASRVVYEGSPEHKRDPGNFNLEPPAAPKPDKTLCDEIDLATREVATELLQRGILCGLISEQMKGDFPVNVWSVTDDSVPVEAQLTNHQKGTYHGYPMMPDDPFRERVLEEWR